MQIRGSTHNRAAFVDQLKLPGKVWDIIIIGGGATGLGIALDAASRGFSTLLLEKSDFAKETSSRSTKLVHGGVRYLEQGNIKLVMEALRERGLLIKNASHLVTNQRFIIPCYSYWSIFMYYIGMKLYDLLSGKLSFGKSLYIGKKNTQQLFPTLQHKNLKGGILYHDGQFDDARLAINIAQTAIEKGALLLNYCEVKSLTKSVDNKINGVTAFDLETGDSFLINAKVVINATGVFVDDILKMDNPHQRNLVRPSQGIHLVFNKKFLNSDSAIMIPKTKDGRVLFIIPWHGKVLVGTTDTPLENHMTEPKALEEEIEFILNTAGLYLNYPPKRTDVLSVFSGLRPLAAPQKDTGSTKEISRSHKILVAGSGLITITGGKWTTYRKMAEEVVNKALKTGGLENRVCITEHLAIHGSTPVQHDIEILNSYGSDAPCLQSLIKNQPDLGLPIIPQHPYLKVQIIWAIRNEMALTVEDVLARRLRILFLDAQLAIDMAPEVAGIMATELNKDQQWQEIQINNFKILAHNYLINP